MDLTVQAYVTEGEPTIEYRLAEEHSSDSVLRYIAFQSVPFDDDEDRFQPLSIAGWSFYMAGEFSTKLALELTMLIKQCPFKGFRFETKGVNLSNSRRETFEFVIVKDDGLHGFASYADPYTFAEQLKTCPDNPSACVFTNLGGDATLISPKNVDKGDKNRYGHIAAFLREAPTTQIQQVWKTVAQTYGKVLADRSPRSVWFSTAGGGVAWLHFRYDLRPKYYRYTPFKNASATP